jgi:hypothetical protein
MTATPTRRSVANSSGLSGFSHELHVNNGLSARTCQLVLCQRSHQDKSSARCFAALRTSRLPRSEGRYLSTSPRATEQPYMRMSFNIPASVTRSRSCFAVPDDSPKPATTAYVQIVQTTGDPQTATVGRGQVGELDANSVGVGESMTVLAVSLSLLYGCPPTTRRLLSWTDVGTKWSGFTQRLCLQVVPPGHSKSASWHR